MRKFSLVPYSRISLLNRLFIEVFEKNMSQLWTVRYRPQTTREIAGNKPA